LEGIALVAIFIWDRLDSRADHKQTIAQLKLAQVSADALINSERAWVIAEFSPLATKFSNGQWCRHVGDGYAALSTEEVLGGQHLRHKLKLTNMGRTPAHILAFEIRYTCLAEGVTDLPKGAAGNYVQVREFNHFLAGAAALQIEDTFDVFALIRDSLDEIDSFKKTAVFHGWVKYRHMFSAADDCYSDFCYVYTASQQRLSSVGRHTKQRQEKGKIMGETGETGETGPSRR